jgi:hypothetical protein
MEIYVVTEIIFGVLQDIHLFFDEDLAIAKLNECHANCPNDPENQEYDIQMRIEEVI